MFKLLASNIKFILEDCGPMQILQMKWWDNHKNRHFPEISIGFKCYNWSLRSRVIKMFVDTEVIGVGQENYVIVLQ